MMLTPKTTMITHQLVEQVDPRTLQQLMITEINEGCVAFTIDRGIPLQIEITDEMVERARTAYDDVNLGDGLAVEPAMRAALKAAFR